MNIYVKVVEVQIQTSEHVPTLGRDTSHPMTFLYLDNADKTKYGSLITGLHSQLSLGNNQFPTNVVGATEIPSNHRLDGTDKKRDDKPTKGNHNEPNKTETKTLSN
jgi:hypothetical protein